jgi:2-C-methyl-D-erythritol 2,4-cyclodiphosphate synthase
VLVAKDASIVNIDATLIAEEPKISPHLAAMKTALSEALSLPPERIGIKATTNEGMGFLGRGEGIAAMAVAGVERP